MKNKKTLKLLVATAIMANLLLASVAAAASETTSSQTVTGGSLQITSVPASQNFVGISVSTSAQTTTAAFASDIAFEDMQGASDTSAWNLTVVTKPFRNNTYSGAGTLAFSAFSILADDTATPAVGGSTNCNANGKITIPAGAPQSYQAFADDTTGTVSLAKTLVNGAAGGPYVDQCTISPEIKLVFPAGGSPGVWMTTMAFSIG